jgi:two-component system phosphate regulon sensor histidine kinase PhoR
MLSSLRFRTAAAYVLLIVAVFAALGIYILQRVEDDFRDTIRADLTSQAQMVKNVAAPLIVEGAPASQLDAVAKDLGAHNDTTATFIGPDGAVLGDSDGDPAALGNQLNEPEVREALRSGQGESERPNDILGGDYTYVATRITEGDSVLGVVRVGRPSATINSALADITRSIFIAVALAGLAGAVTSLAIGTAVLRPLSGLARAARSMAAGDLSARVSPRPSGEVGQVADAFNQMAHSLQELIAAASDERRRLTAALNSGTDAVLAVNSEGRITFANQAAERLFSRTREQLLGNPFVWVMPDEPLVEALRASREEGRRETRIVERPNRQFLQVTATPIIGGGEWSALVVSHDLTDVKRLEQVRRDFVANVSHELRTPLASVKSVIETLQGGALSEEATAREFLDRADMEVDRLVLMVEELLELSRIESGEVPLAHEPVEIAGVIAQAAERLRPQADRRGIALSVELARDLPSITGDADRLERAAVNLIHNAIKFTPAGGAIHVSAAAEDGAVAVRVSDTGAGIAPEDLPRVFERFYKADRSRGSRGSGLGLAVVKHTVEAHGGSIRAESELGRGSTFSFSIPVAAADGEPSQAASD